MHILLSNDQADPMWGSPLILQGGIQRANKPSEAHSYSLSQCNAPPTTQFLSQSPGQALVVGPPAGVLIIFPRLLCGDVGWGVQCAPYWW